MRLANILNRAGGMVADDTVLNNDACLDVKVAKDGELVDIKRILYVDAQGNRVPISKRLVETRVPGDKYVVGQLACSAGRSFNNHTAGSAMWGLDCTFKLDDLSSTKFLIQNAVASTGAWSVWVDTNGSICYNTTYTGGSSSTATWQNDFPAIKAWQWYTLSMRGHIGGGHSVQVSLNGSATVTKVNLSDCYASSKARSVIFGQSGVSFKQLLAVYGTDYSNSSVQRSVVVDIDDAVVGSQLLLTSNGFTVTGSTVLDETKVGYAWQY